MPHYRFDFSYTSDSWGKLMHTPADRTEAIRPVVEKLGGRFIALYYTMGATDGFVLAELADDATAMAFALSAIAPGHVKGVNTMRLYSPQEMMEGLRRAQSVTLPTPK